MHSCVLAACIVHTPTHVQHTRTKTHVSIFQHVDAWDHTHIKVENLPACMRTYTQAYPHTHRQTGTHIHTRAHIHGRTHMYTYHICICRLRKTDMDRDRETDCKTEEKKQRCNSSCHSSSEDISKEPCISQKSSRNILTRDLFVKCKECRLDYLMSETFYQHTTRHISTLYQHNKSYTST